MNIKRNLKIKRVIDNEYSQETSELIQDENINMEETNDRLYPLDAIIDAEFNTDMLINMSIDGLRKTHQQIKRLADNIVEEYFKRICATQEILPTREEYNLVFEWIKETSCDLCDFSNAISFYNILYKQEEDNALPYLSYSKKQNWNVLYNEYYDLLKSFISISDDVNINYTIETLNNAFDLLERYYYKRPAKRSLLANNWFNSEGGEYSTKQKVKSVENALERVKIMAKVILDDTLKNLIKDWKIGLGQLSLGITSDEKPEQTETKEKD